VRSGELRKQAWDQAPGTGPFMCLQSYCRGPATFNPRRLRIRTGRRYFVISTNSLNTANKQATEALGDSADNPDFIETLPRRGLRFIAPVTNEMEQREDCRWCERSVPLRSRKIVVTGNCSARCGNRRRTALRARVKCGISREGHHRSRDSPIRLATQYSRTLREGLSVEWSNHPSLAC